MIQPTETREADVRRYTISAGALAFLLLLVRTAWLDDDAYITFRTVDNFLNGYGLRWNVVDRVQSYTHPLWMLVMTAATAVIRDVYFAAIVVSIVCSMAAVVLVIRTMARTSAAALAALSALMLSKAFVDYSTSGLENPLTHLLLAGFFLLYFGHFGTRRILWLSLVASLLMVNRLDVALIIAPALTAAIWREGVRRSAVQVLIGLLPLVAWEIFSIVYYGFPFPNTAYSKLKTGVPRGALLHQGALYLLDSLANDPLTLVVIVGAALTPVLTGSRLVIPLGALLYVAYTVWVGGDFMSGRFLVAPFFVSAMQLARQPLPRFDGAWLGVMAVIWLMGLSAPRPTLASNQKFGSDIEPAQAIAPTGITDERRYYYPQSGLLTLQRGAPHPNHRWIHMGHDLRAGREKLFFTDAAGFIGYAAGPEVHFVDKYGLGDPLIARLPAEEPWRIGHFRRLPPEGYEETLRAGKNVIGDPSIGEYYQRLLAITRDPIWSARRWRTILRMNVGAYEHLLDTYGLVHVPLETVSQLTPDKPMTISVHGVQVDLPAPSRLRGVELTVSRNDRYRLVWLRQGRPVREDVIDQILSRDGSVTAHTITVDKPIEADALRILPSGGDSSYSVGPIRLLS